MCWEIRKGRTNQGQLIQGGKGQLPQPTWKARGREHPAGGSWRQGPVLLGLGMPPPLPTSSRSPSLLAPPSHMKEPQGNALLHSIFLSSYPPLPSFPLPSISWLAPHFSPPIYTAIWFLPHYSRETDLLEAPNDFSVDKSRGLLLNPYLCDRQAELDLKQRLCLENLFPWLLRHLSFSFHDTDHNQCCRFHRIKECCCLHVWMS